MAFTDIQAWEQGSSVDNESYDELPAYTAELNDAVNDSKTSPRTISFNPIDIPVENHHQTVKAIFSSDESVASLINIIGTYVARKREHEELRQYHSKHSVFYENSRMEIQMYNRIMQKLETLSGIVIQRKPALRKNWEAAVGHHRQQAFLELYNANEIVRSFAKEIPDAPSTIPVLNDSALGINKGKSSSVPNARPSNPSDLLSKVRTVVLMADSASMNKGAVNVWKAVFADNNEKRWDQARRMLANIAPLVTKNSKHGIDLFFVNRDAIHTGLHNDSEVMDAFNAGKPEGNFLFAQRINDILDGYMSTLRYYRNLMPLNLVVITDEEGNSYLDLFWAIFMHLLERDMRGYPPHQFGIEFIQMGDSEDATRCFVKLEEAFSRRHRSFKKDFIGVTPTTRINKMDPETLLAIITSGIDARLNSYLRNRGTNV